MEDIVVNPTEEIARVVSAKRNEIRLASCNGDVEGLAKVKKSNLEEYGNENGPTAEFLFAKDGDYLIKIAKKFYGSAEYWKQIAEINKDKVGKDYLIITGDKLVIP